MGIPSLSPLSSLSNMYVIRIEFKMKFNSRFNKNITLRKTLVSRVILFAKSPKVWKHGWTTILFGSLSLRLSHKREFVPREQAFPLTVVNYLLLQLKISIFTPVLYMRIVLESFYLLLFYSEKFSTWICHLPFGVNANLNPSNIIVLTSIGDSQFL